MFFLTFFLNFFKFFLIFIYNLKKKLKLPRVNLTLCHVIETMMWQWQCHVSILDVKSLNVVPIFVILSQFDPNFVKIKSISSCTKFKFYINFTMVFLL